MTLRARSFVALAVPVAATAWLSVVALAHSTPVVAPARAVTFSETIAPIFYDNCVTCHRPGEAAPFSLITYEDASKRGALLAKVTASRYMPP